MQSKRQPKVHTYSKKRRRKVRPGRAILSIGFTFLVAGVIGVVGYSVAKPILQYSGAEHSQTSRRRRFLLRRQKRRRRKSRHLLR